MEISDLFFNNFDRLRRKHLRRIDEGDGVFRKVYRIQTNAFGRRKRGKVVKIARKSKSIRSNSAEFQTWMSVKGTPLEKHFCPIRDRSEKFEFIVMDYANTGNISFDDLQELAQKIKNQTGDIDVPVDQQRGMDIAPRNIGVHEKKGTVMIDYPWGANWRDGSDELRND